MYYPDGNHGGPTSGYVRKAIQHAAEFLLRRYPLLQPFLPDLSDREEQIRAKEDRADER